MEKEKNKVRILNRWIKLIFIFVYVLVFLGMVAFEVWFQVVGSSLDTQIYWMILFGWIFLIWHFRWRSSVSMVSALTLFIFSAFLITLGFGNLGEITMRLSFVGWLVGIVQALVEYRSNEKS